MGPPRRGGVVPGVAEEALKAPAFFLALSVLWTWPAATGAMVTRQFDLYVAGWVASLGWDAFDLHTTRSAWPLGESLVGVDSLFLLFLPVPVVTVLGPALSAWAAERCAARAFGVPEPASWIAGLAYGFSGVAGSAFLEGHVYWLLNPWLPLLVWGLVAGPRWIAGIGFAGAVFTSGYLALIAGIVVVVYRRFHWSFLPTAAAYLWLFSHRSGDATFGDTFPFSRGGNTLASAAGWTPLSDLGSHSIAAPLGWVSFWALFLVPGEWRLKGLAALGLVLSFGGVWFAEAGVEGVVTPLLWLGYLPGAEVVHFPIRFAWLFALAGGLLACRMPRPRLVLALVLVDVLLVGGVPFRSGEVVADAPRIEGEGAVLDIVPVPLDLYRQGDPRARAYLCHNQRFHQRPILEPCLLWGMESPRVVVERWMVHAMGLGHEVAGPLGRLGVGSVVLHLDRFRPEDLAWFRLDLPFVETVEGGGALRVYTLPRVGGDPVAAYTEIVAEDRAWRGKPP